MIGQESQLRAGVLAWREDAKAWFAEHGREVAIVIPSYRDAALLAALFDGLDVSTPPGKWRAVISDDASGDAGHLAFLDRLAQQRPEVTVLRNETNGGFAVNVNRALRVVPDGVDVVLMNSDVVPLDGWLAALQYSLHLQPADLIAPKMLYPNGTIQFCGGMPLPGTGWFDHRFRHRDEYFAPATVRSLTLYATGAALYIPAATRRRIGELDPGYVWSHDDVDYAIRCWLAGGRVVVEPRATIIHHESATIGQGSRDPRIAPSAMHFWNKNRGYFQRTLRARDGRLRAIFVVRGLGAPADSRILAARALATVLDGIECEVWNLGTAPHFLDYRVRARGFATVDALLSALDAEDAVKICADWRLAETVWLGSVRRGLPAYWARPIPKNLTAEEVATIEASYLPEFTIFANDGDTARAISEAGFDRPVIVPDRSSLAPLLRRMAQQPVFGDGRLVAL